MVSSISLASRPVTSGGLATTTAINQARALNSAAAVVTSLRFSPAPGTTRRCGAPLGICHAAGTDSIAKTDGAFMFVDADASAAALKQPMPEEEMIATATEFLATSVLDITKLGDFMSDDFRFVAPVVGPLSKDEFLAAFGGFNILEGFPDLNPRYHHFRLDPFEAGRVWFTTTAVANHTGKLANNEATGIEVRSPPQTCSVIINDEGLISKYTIGYVNDKELGNTGGLGGIFGIFYAIGSPLPFPEANPWKKSKRYAFFQWLGSLSSSQNKKD